ncbi:MAG: outer membrane beta-barrel protein [Ferruginibacter sp.]
MKTKLILLFTAAAFLLSLAPAVTNAQFSKGNMFVEGALGNLSVSNNKAETERNGIRRDYTKSNGFSIGIMPRVGFFVADNLAVGTTLGINFYSNKYKYLDPLTSFKDAESKSSSVILDFMPFARYYFGKSNSTRFYGQIGGGISTDLSRKSEYKEFNSSGVVDYTSKTNYPKKYFAFSGEALVGLNHFVSQNVAINAALGYRYNSSKETNSNTTTYLGITTTSPEDKYTNKGGVISWNVGFTMFIPCNKKGKK